MVTLKTLETIEEIIDEAESKGDSQVDTEALRASLTSRANSLQKIDKAEKPRL